MRLKFTLLSFLMVPGMAFLGVHRQCEAQRARYRIARLADEVAHLRNENLALSARVAVLTAAPTLRASAAALKVPSVRMPVVYVAPRARNLPKGAGQ